MQDFSFVCLSHPLAEAYLDDDQSFLNTIKFEFRQKKLATFTSPLALSNIITNEVEPLDKVLNFSSTEVTDSIEQRQIKFSILDLHKLIYDKSRFNYIAIVIVDYNMPEMTGIEFCENIKTKHVYKILLTANEDIDKFIMKQVRELFSRLETALIQLKQRYFIDLTKPVLPSLGDEINALAGNNEFLSLCNTTYTVANAVEYYLMDKSGSYFFLDKDANPTWLLVRHEKYFIEQLQMLQGFDAAASLLDALENRDQLLFLLSEIEYKKPVSEWAQHMFACQRLEGSDIYYAIVTEKVSDAIDWDRVIPFDDSI